MSLSFEQAANSPSMPTAANVARHDLLRIEPAFLMSSLRGGGRRRCREWRAGQMRSLAREVTDLQIQIRAVRGAADIGRPGTQVFLQGVGFVALGVVSVAPHFVKAPCKGAGLHAVQSREREIRLLLRNLHPRKP